MPTPSWTDDWDDGHTIADMSEVRGSHAPDVRSSRPASEELQDREERLMVLLGTLRAALSVGLVYVVIFGIAIALMVHFWT